MIPLTEFIFFFTDSFHTCFATPSFCIPLGAHLPSCLDLTLYFPTVTKFCYFFAFTFLLLMSIHYLNAAIWMTIHRIKIHYHNSSHLKSQNQIQMFPEFNKSLSSSTVRNSNSHCTQRVFFNVNDLEFQ